MNKSKNLDKLEKRVFKDYQKDGLLDLMISWLLLGFGLQILTGSATFIFITIFPIFLYRSLKNKFTIPRFGYATFETAPHGHSKRAMNSLIVGLTVLVFLGLVVFLQGNNPDSSLATWLKNYPTLVFGILPIAGFLVAGLITGITRFYFYSVFSLGLTLAIHLSEGPLYLLFLVLGGCLFFVGLILLIRFLRKNPIITAEELNASN